MAGPLITLVLALSALLAAAQPGLAETVIATEQAPSKLSTEGKGHGVYVAWSSYEPATGNYFLMTRDPFGVVSRVPVAPRRVPFDVDMGEPPGGGTIAVYSRCRQEPALIGGSPVVLPAWATGRGCDLYQFDFESGHESRATGASTRRASEFLPSASGRRLAFARVYERRPGRRGRLPYLYVRRDSRTARRLPGGPRGKTGLPGPTSLDLVGDLLLFGWDWVNPSRGFRSSDVRLDLIGHGHRLLATTITGIIGRMLITPSMPGSACWGRVIIGEAGEGSAFFNYRIGSRTLLLAPAPHALVSTACDYGDEGLRTYYIRAKELVIQTGVGVPACDHPASQHPAACVVADGGYTSFTPIEG